MSFFDIFKKKEKSPAEKEDEPIVEEIKLETIETEIEMKMDDADWIASKDEPVVETTEEPEMAEKKKTEDKPAAAKKPAAAAKKSDSKVWHIQRGTKTACGRSKRRAL